MDLLHEKIKNDGKIFAGNILKVDSFLNHQIDVDFMEFVSGHDFNVWVYEFMEYLRSAFPR